MRRRSLGSAITIALLLYGAATVHGSIRSVHAENNGVGLTPAMGWSSWSFIRRSPTAAKIEAQADAMKSSGLAAAGFQYVNLDDFWYQCPGSQGPNVDQYGRWVTDTTKFPSSGSTDGIQVVADYVHNDGLRFGLYVTPGISMQAVAQNTPIEGTVYHAADIATTTAEHNYNCHGMVGIDYTKPGAQAFINSWADEFASWGVDYLKIDGVGTSDIPDIQAWSAALQQTGRPIHLELSNNLAIGSASTWQQYANGWRTGGDIECYSCESGGSSYPLTSWASVQSRFNQVANWQPYGGPGGFNDYDSLEVGNGSHDGLTPDERRTMMSLWAMGASPLILGTDLTNLDPTDLGYLENTDVLAVDQDSIDASRVVNAGSQQVFSKTESNGSVVVALFNLSTSPQVVSVSASALGLPSGTGFFLNDLWAHQTTETAGAISPEVAPHGVVMYRVTPASDPTQAPPNATFALNAPASVTAGQQVTVTESFTDNGALDAQSVTLGLQAPSSWSPTATSPTSFPTVPSGQTVQATFQLTPQTLQLFETDTLAATAGYTWSGGTSLSLSVNATVSASSPVQPPYQTFSSATDAPAAFGQSGQELGISGAGADVFSGHDNYSAIYLHGAVGTSSTIQTEVLSQQAMTGFAKAGIMVRNNVAGAGTTPEGVILFASPSGGFQLEWDSNGGSYINSVTPPNGTIPESLPVWLRLVRNGSSYTGYYSTDGSTWNRVGSATVPSQAATQDAGLFVVSHVAGSPGQVLFNGLSVKQGQTITFSSAAPAGAVYGGTYTPAATASSGLPVTLSLDGASTGCSLNGGSLSFTGPGTCVVDADQAGDSNYTAAPQAQQSFGIGPAPLTVTADNQSMTYGGPVPALTYQVSGFVNGETLATSGVTGSASCTTPATASSAVGTYPIMCGAGSLAATNYAFPPAGFLAGTLTVTQASQTITFTSTAPSGAVYGGTYTPAATASSGLPVTLSLDGASAGCSLGGGGVSFTGPGTCVVDADQAGDSNHTAAPQAQQSFGIGPAPLTVTADNQSMTFGGPVPALTYQVSGFVNGETLATSGVTGSASCTTSATASSPVGSYPITCSAGSLAATNYAFPPAGFVAGTLTVTQASQTITFTSTAPSGAVYGGTYTPAVTASSGLPATLSLDGASTGCSLNGGSLSFTGVGTCVIDADQAGDSNYTAAPRAQQSFGIGPAPLTVTADNQSMTYGSPLPALTYQVSGFVNGETLATSGVTGSASCTTPATASSPAGTYPITCGAGSLAATNYAFPPAGFVAGTLTVTRHPATIGYTGGLFFSTGGSTSSTASVTLQATVVPAAGGSVDVTRAGVAFLLYRSGNVSMATPDASCTAASVSSSGVATCTLASLGVDDWTVIAIIPSGNAYFSAPYADPVVMTVYVPTTDTFATGGGWVTDPSATVSTTNRHGTFGFIVRNGNTGAPQGQSVYVFRGADGYDYVVKSNSWQGGGLAFGSSTAGFSGKCSVVVIDPATGLQVPGLGGGNYTYRVDVTDNGTSGDTYAISVYTPAGALWHQAGTTASQLPLGGGGIVVHSR